MNTEFSNEVMRGTIINLTSEPVTAVMGYEKNYVVD